MSKQILNREFQAGLEFENLYSSIRHLLKLLLLIAIGVTMTYAAFGENKDDSNTMDSAKVIIYRPKHTYGFMWWIKMHDNKSNKYIVKNNSIQYLNLPVGETTFKIKDIGRNHLTLNLETDKIYYIKINLRAGILFGVPEIAEVTETTFNQEADLKQ